MKIHVEFEMTPEEFRKSVGLPDVEMFNDTAISQMQQVFKSGAMGLEDFLNPVISQSLDNISMMQNLMLQALAGSEKSKKDAKTTIEIKESQETKPDEKHKLEPKKQVKKETKDNHDITDK